jgi:hypothetical protein
MSTTERRSPSILFQPLTPQDYAMLESCYISAAIADDAGIVRVASLEGSALGAC